MKDKDGYFDIYKGQRVPASKDSEGWPSTDTLARAMEASGMSMGHRHDWIFVEHVGDFDSGRVAEACICGESRIVDVKVEDKKVKERQRGAAAVEFALIAPVFFMLLFGMIEFGFNFYMAQNLRSGVREGARVAVVGGTTAQIQQKVADNVPGLQPSSVIITNPCVPGVDGNVSVSINTGSGSNYGTLPSNIVSALKVSIPLIPTMNTHPNITGTMRCET